MQVKAEMFTWVRTAGAAATETGRIGAQEYSTLGVPPGCRPDVIDVTNTQTGRTVRFVYERSIYCPRENELLTDVFKPSAADLLRYPHLQFTRLHCHND